MKKATLCRKTNLFSYLILALIIIVAISADYYPVSGLMMLCGLFLPLMIFNLYIYVVSARYEARVHDYKNLPKEINKLNGLINLDNDELKSYFSTKHEVASLGKKIKVVPYDIHEYRKDLPEKKKELVEEMDNEDAFKKPRFYDFFCKLYRATPQQILKIQTDANDASVFLSKDEKYCIIKYMQDFFEPQQEPSGFEKNKKLIIGIGVFLFVTVLVVTFVLIAVYIYKLSKQEPETRPTVNQLPNGLDFGDIGNGLGDDLANLKAEETMFGHYYKNNQEKFRIEPTDYELPLDIKADAENYYEVSRTIDLDPYLEHLNEYGYAIIDNPYESDDRRESGNDDFFSVYNRLLVDEIPIVLTSDFLIYYYQNTLKNAYDEIERLTFYKTMWDTNKRLFDIASARYSERLGRVGVSSDSILEGQRLQTVYLAVLLKLLVPTQEQVSSGQALRYNEKFTQKEVEYYDFALPAHLSDDVENELNLIRKHVGIQESPSFRYEMDYSRFSVPREIKEDAKLNNFYLAARWMNSVFPLYFQADNCPECLLDKNDWLISTIAASYLAQDISGNQSLKNRWAVLYKFISFFRGLRQDITYLDYDRALRELYGENYKLENIFSRDKVNDLVIFKFQSKVLEKNFSVIEGGYERNGKKDPRVGMRMLQENYWSNSYIFDRLTGDKFLTNKEGDERDLQQTSCGKTRCAGTGLDIFNLQVPIENNERFDIESDYTAYDYEVQQLRDYMRGFNVFTWNNNMYWSSVDMMNKMLGMNRVYYPVYMRSDKWQNQKALNTALGAWTNVHLSTDVPVNYTGEISAAANSGRPICDLPNYIEPGLDLLYEGVARNNMLVKMMDILKVSDKANLAVSDIGSVTRDFERAIEINKKELSGELMSFSDCMFIREVVEKKQVKTEERKEFTINLDKTSMRERLNGVKLLVLVFAAGDRKVIVVGPVFDHQEYYPGER